MDIEPLTRYLYSPMLNQNAIIVEKLKKDFTVHKDRGWFRRYTTKVEAVKSIDLQVRSGEALAFIGPNGAGKSTMIKMLTGILHPTSGYASVLGYVPWVDRTRLAYRIGSVFGQKSQLWLHLAPIHTFELLSHAYRLERGPYLKKRNELVSLFELDEIVNTPVRKLSLGQRMRCEIAASLLHEPEILFLDEPTIGLDPVAKAAIRDLIKLANKESGLTVFLTSHDAGDIEHLCKRVVIINEGRVVMDDTTRALQQNFLKKKEIELKLDVPFANDINIAGVNVIKFKGYGVKLSVDPALAPIDQVVAHILKQYRVQDIVIQNPPLEEVIAAIYRSGVAGAACGN